MPAGCRTPLPRPHGFGRIGRRHGMNLPRQHPCLTQRRAYARDEVVGQEPPSSPIVLQRITEHPQGEHIEEKVREIAVHEHIGDELPEMEIGGRDIVQAQPTCEVDAPPREREVGQIEKHVDDEQVLYHRRQETDSPGTVGTFVIVVIHYETGLTF